MTNKFVNLKKAVEEAAILCNAKGPVDENFKLEEIDSLGRAEIIVALEEQFGLTMTNEQILNMHTYGDLVEFVRKQELC